MLKSKTPFFFIFALSGFSGLIYESIWTHYLKLFLGHAAYAQTLVLAIFMGGMACGAWFIGKYSRKLKNLLIGYAVVEGIIGIFALFFHNLFVNALHFSYYTVLPMLGTSSTVTIFLWTLAALLILPQSVLLGTTFPLMSAGIIRRFPNSPGATLAILYFANSLGAAIGVLASGFILIDLVGLPGTVLAGGVLNLLITCAVIVLSKASNEESNVPATVTRKEISDSNIRWDYCFLAVAFLTGAASFIYEIGWIRMLSLVLGSSTHSFELMLSAFILGMALGGFWIKRRIDTMANPENFIGIIQIVMGIMAVMTLPIYGNSFNIMAWLLKALAKTDQGYVLFNLSGQFISMIIMMPATFCAGMTLPLITNILLQKGNGEGVIGRVYAGNTLGAIAGLFFAVHIGMPYFGLKNLILTGAAIDIITGVFVLAVAAGSMRARLPSLAGVLGIAVIGSYMLFVHFDPAVLSSGVYRNTIDILPTSAEVIYYRDGKTATVTVVKSSDGKMSILTNGKPDASIQMETGGPLSTDESTQALLGAVPFMLKPNTQKVASIGMGSGITSSVLLASTRLERLDIIEIEPFMVKAAENFRPKNERVYTDPRSNIHIDDAKAFFASNREKYDVIVSEPSNPWVSGVAGLFSVEFYEIVSEHLEDDGLLIQWIHLYSMDENLFGSVIKAISEKFSDYSLYTTSMGDILIAARKKGKVGRIDSSFFDTDSRLTAILRRVGIKNMQDIDILWLGDKNILDPYYTALPTHANSDYFPVLDLNAVKMRYLGHIYTDLVSISVSSLPVLQMLSGIKNDAETTDITPYRFYTQHQRAVRVMRIRDYLSGDKNLRLPSEIQLQADIASLNNLECGSIDSKRWEEALTFTAMQIAPFLSVKELNKIWSQIESRPCFQHLAPHALETFRLVKAVSNRNGQEMADIATKILKENKEISDIPYPDYVFGAALLGHLATDNPGAAGALWKRYAPEVIKQQKIPIVLRLLALTALSSLENGSSEGFQSESKAF